MSATPAPNALHELWSAVDWLHPEYLGKSFWEFKKIHCVPHPVFPGKIVSYRNEEFLREKFYKYIYRVERIQVKDELNLPPFTENIIYVSPADVA